ncbi:MAG: sigma-70 family RNA polymerase sigma factor [Acidimicrobiales bacterium]
MSERGAARADQGAALLQISDRALPEVFGYLVTRCGSETVAEDLTSETFLAAVTAIKHDRVSTMTVVWLVGVARHKLVDHWRSQGRESRRLALVEGEEVVDDWDEHLDQLRARGVMAQMSPAHRAALTMRYLDGLPVAEVADLMDRTLHATEALLVRARGSFRRSYGERGDDAD